MLTSSEVEILKLKIEIRETIITILDLSIAQDDLEDILKYLKECI